MDPQWIPIEFPCGFPMDSQLNPQCIPSGFQMDPQRIPQWTPTGIPNRSPKGSPKVFPVDSCEFPICPQRIPNGFPVNSQWIPNLPPMDPQWIPYCWRSLRQLSRWVGLFWCRIQSWGGGQKKGKKTTKIGQSWMKVENPPRDRPKSLGSFWGLFVCFPLSSPFLPGKKFQNFRRIQAGDEELIIRMKASFKSII